MAQRTTNELVAGIIQVNPRITLDPFIAVASSLVDALDEEVNDDEQVLTSSVLTLIETWLAAHFYAVRDPRRDSEKAGSVAATFESKVDLGLNITRYGQQAMIIDISGWLRRLNTGGRKVRVMWLGTPADWQTTP